MFIRWRAEGLIERHAVRKIAAGPYNPCSMPLHGYVGLFRVTTVETKRLGATEWTSTAYIHHGDEAGAIRVLPDVGCSADRMEARRQGMRAGVQAAQLLNAGVRNRQEPPRWRNV
ncbi:hypothetical protein [Xanthomonas campestris]|uniref:hypothetical protein n=1 Tax=Xanthomonas campestris TaxID=339 RepID=UPI001CD31503|nr:hypothetical protein [Xanthomonas campestris]